MIDLKKTAAELKIPVNVLLNIGRDFIEDTMKVVEEIRASVDNLSYGEISALSHKSRGAAANLRFVKVSEYFLELEEKASGMEKDFDYTMVLDNIINEINHLKNYF